MGDSNTTKYVEFQNQVAGHVVEGDINIGLIKESEECVLKPLTKPYTARNEISFYRDIWSSSDEIIGIVKEFVPTFRGLVNLPINGKELTFIRLQDVTVGLKKPCIADIKIGFQTWDPNACQSKKLAEEVKYVESRKYFKFCIPGYQVHDIYSGCFIKRNKSFGKALNTETLPEALKEFTNWKSGGSSIVCHFFIIRLEEMLQWWQMQKKVSLYSSSILLLYDAVELDNIRHVSDPKMVGVTRVPWIRAYMIDFAHAIYNDEPKLDTNYIEGLASLINQFKLCK